MADFAFAIPSNTTTVDYVPRVLNATFSDGYSQRVADGLNSSLAVFNLEWDNIGSAVLTQIHNFLQSKLGTTAFTWQAPDPVNALVNVICTEWHPQYIGGDMRMLTAIFRQVAVP
jgi:phage-related protein